MPDEVVDQYEPADLTRKGPKYARSSSFLNPSSIGAAMENCGYTLEEHIFLLTETAKNAEKDSDRLRAMSMLSKLAKDSTVFVSRLDPANFRTPLETSRKASTLLSDSVAIPTLKFHGDHPDMGTPKTTAVRTDRKEQDNDRTEHHLETPGDARAGEDGDITHLPTETGDHLSRGASRVLRDLEDGKEVHGSYHLPPETGEEGSDETFQKGIVSRRRSKAVHKDTEGPGLPEPGRG